MLTSLFVTAKPNINIERDLALLQARQLLAQDTQIQQVFFYQQGVLHAKPSHAVIWRQLFPDTTLMLCSQYVQQYNLEYLHTGFAVQGLIDFFAKHSQHQSQLIQIRD